VSLKSSCSFFAIVSNFLPIIAGETIRINYNKKIYDIDVVDVKPRDHGGSALLTYKICEPSTSALTLPLGC
jgi:hypothetical protein